MPLYRAPTLPELVDVDDGLTGANGAILQYSTGNSWWTHSTGAGVDQVLMMSGFGYVARSVVKLSNRPMWKSTATAAVAEQGLNLPAALTELDATQQGTRFIVDATDFPGSTQFKVSVCMRGIVQTARTINVSVRPVANTANVLATCAVVVPNTTPATFTVEGAWTNQPSWFTSGGNNQTLALYTDTGNGADDYVFKDVTLWWQGW